MWAPDVEIPPITNVAASRSAASCRSTVPEPNPRRDAARTKILKKLRHKLTTSCSAKNQSSSKNNSKPPVLAFERWLARYALRRSETNGAADDEMGGRGGRGIGSGDPLIPSDNFIDNALARDLARTGINFDDAKDIAKQLAEGGKEGADRIMKEFPEILKEGDAKDHEKDLAAGRKRARKDIKASVKAIKKKAKMARTALEVDDEDTGGDIAADIMATLNELRSATSALEQTIKLAQRTTTTATSNDASDGAADGGISISGSRRRGIYDVALRDLDGKPKRPYLTISKAHLWKLIQLWTFAEQDKDMGIGNASPSTSIDSIEGDPVDFLNNISHVEQAKLRKSIYSCLSRYEALRGAGYQCAVPDVAFEAAAKACGLGHTIECFASPLNCRYRKYCSAFPDVETKFGSLGSFFNDAAFNPMEGTFEANPPFVPETMVAMGEKIECMLADTRRGPLSFLVVVPAWGAGISFCTKMESSVHMRARARIPAADHAFFDGAQHTKPGGTDGTTGANSASLLRPSSWDTAVILMQNNKGSKRWPVSGDELEASFCAAMCNAGSFIPESSRTLEKWERRGVAEGGSIKQHGLKRRRDSTGTFGGNHPKREKCRY